MKIKPEEFVKEMQKALNEYSAATTNDVQEAVEEVTKEARLKVRERARSYNWRNYPRNITSRVDRNTVGAIGTVYVKGEDYRLAHLLENGHAVVRGGERVGYARPFPHFEDGERLIERELINRVKEKMR